MELDGPSTAWILDGFQAWVALWAWTALVLLHAMWRSFHGPEADPVRDSGPVR